MGVMLYVRTILNARKLIDCVDIINIIFKISIENILN